MVFHFMLFTVLRSWALIGEGKTLHNTTVLYSTSGFALLSSGGYYWWTASSPFLCAQWQSEMTTNQHVISGVLGE